jgi:hypothetical protein
LKNVPFAGGRAWLYRCSSLIWTVRWWLKLHRRFFEMTTYKLKARAVARDLNRRRSAA